MIAVKIRRCTRNSARLKAYHEGRHWINVVCTKGRQSTASQILAKPGVPVNRVDVHKTLDRILAFGQQRADSLLDATRDGRRLAVKMIHEFRGDRVIFGVNMLYYKGGTRICDSTSYQVGCDHVVRKLHEVLATQ